MTRLLTLPFRLAWRPIAWFLRLLGFGAGIKRHSWQPPAVDAEHHVWAVVRERRESEGTEPVVRLRPDRGARRPARVRGTRVSVLRSTGKALIPAAAILVLAIATVGAFAYYTSSGTGSASASVGTLNPPTGVAGSPSGSTVTVSWAAPSGGVTPQGYYVTRVNNSDSSTANACGTSPTTPTLATGTTCSDNSVSPGTYHYVVTSVFNSWTAASTASGAVVVASPASKLAIVSSVISGAATGSATLGPLTVQIQDASGNPVNAGAGGVTVQLSSTSSTGKFAATSGGTATAVRTVTIPAGASTNPASSAFYLDLTAGSPVITATWVSGGAGLTSGPQTETITAAGLASFAFALASPQTDGVAFNGTNTLTAKDAFGNTITSFSAASDNVTVAAVAPLTGAVSGLSGGNVLKAAGDFVNGVANLTSLGLVYTGNAASGTFKATSADNKTGTSGSVTIAVGALSKFAFALASPQTDGLMFTGTNTLTAQDAGGNTITSFNAATNNVTITANAPLTGAVSGLDTPANVLNVAADFVNGVANLTSLGMTYTGNAGSGTFTATSGTKTGISGNVAINASTASKLAIVSSVISGAATGSATLGPLTVQIQDVGGNPVNATAAVTVRLSSSSATGSFAATSGGAATATRTVTIPNGSSTNAPTSAFYLDTTAGSPVITAAKMGGGGTLTSGTQTETITAAGLASFAFALATPQTDGVAFTGTNTLTAQDAFGNVITSFNAATNNVTIAANPPLTGAVSGLDTPANVLNAAGDFVNGVANLTSLGMVYTGNAAAATFTATSGTKTGTSGSVTIAVGALSKFAFTLATTQTDGAVFTGTNTLTAQDVGGNTITNFNAAANNVTIAANAPLTGAVSGLDTPTNVLNVAADFVNGVANLTTLGMTYTGNAGSGTFTATSANGKTGTSGSVTIAVGALSKFAFVLANPQTDGVAFAGTNSLTAQDVGGNTITSFNAATSNVTIAANSALTGAVSGLDTPANVLNAAGDFVNGVANLTSLGMVYTGNAASGTFTATSGTKTGTSGSVTIVVGALSKFALTLASPQTNGAAFAGTNTLAAQDVGGNTITSFNASSDNVTVAAVGPLTGTVSGLSGGNVLNAAGDFVNGVANLTSLGMIYTGNAASGTFTATSADNKTGTSGTVAIAPGALDHFAFVLASPQANGTAFTGIDTLTAQDLSGNTITSFNAATNAVAITANAPLTGAISGLDTPANVLDTAGDFVNGVANLSALGMTYTGNAGSGTFTATSGTRTGTSGSVTITAVPVIALVSGQQFSTGGIETANTPFGLTLPNTTTVGHTLILVLSDDGSGGATATVSGGGVPASGAGSWTQVESVLGNGSPNNGAVEIWYGLVTSAGNKTITVSMSHNGNVQLANVSEWSGIATSNPLDPNSSTSLASRTTPGLGTTFVAGPATGTLSQTNELVVTDAWVESGFGYLASTFGATTGPFVDATTGYTALSEWAPSLSNFYRGWAAFQIDPSTTPLSATWTEPSSSPNGPYATAIAAFKHQ